MAASRDLRPASTVRRSGRPRAGAKVRGAQAACDVSPVAQPRRAARSPAPTPQLRRRPGPNSPRKNSPARPPGRLAAAGPTPQADPAGTARPPRGTPPADPDGVAAPPGRSRAPPPRASEAAAEDPDDAGPSPAVGGEERADGHAATSGEPAQHARLVARCSRTGAREPDRRQGQRVAGHVGQSVGPYPPKSPSPSGSAEVFAERRWREAPRGPRAAAPARERRRPVSREATAAPSVARRHPQAGQLRRTPVTRRPPVSGVLGAPAARPSSVGRSGVSPRSTASPLSSNRTWSTAPSPRGTPGPAARGAAGSPPSRAQVVEGRGPTADLGVAAAAVVETGVWVVEGEQVVDALPLALVEVVEPLLGLVSARLLRRGLRAPTRSDEHGGHADRGRQGDARPLATSGDHGGLSQRRPNRRRPERQGRH